MTLSASATPRIFACPTSAVLPQREYRTQYAEQGNERHAAREVAADLRDLSKLPHAVASMIRPSDRLLTEHVFTIDVATGEGRHHGPASREDYPRLIAGRPFAFPGRIDLLILGTDRAIVVDYKGFNLVDPAETNAQLASYALMVARAFGLDEVSVVIVYELRRPSIADLGPLDLDAHAERLRRMFGDVAAARMNPGRYLVVGPQCEFCPAFDACPRQKALALDVETGLIRARIEDVVPFADDQEAQWALDLLGELKLLSSRLHAALAQRAEARPIPLASGNMWGPRTKLGNRKIDGDTAYEVVRRRYGDGIAAIVAPRVATQKALKEALEFVDGDPRAILEEIEAAGGVNRKPQIEYTEYPPGLRLVEGA